MAALVLAVDLQELASAEPSALVAFESQLWEEHAPGEPALSERSALWLATREHPSSARSAWIVRSEGGGLAGVATLSLPLADNLRLGVVDVRVVPGERRRGIGRALLRALARHADEAGRASLIGWTWSMAPGGGRFARATGASAGQVIRRSELDLTTLDRALLPRWRDVPADVRQRYELVPVHGPYPVDQYAAIAEIEAVMDTAPRDGLDVEDHVYDAEWVAQRERQQAVAPGDRWTTFVRDRSTGRFVGFTQVFFYDDWPGHVDQGNTGVHPDHRGNGLGRWLKASMIDQVLRERPSAGRVWTTNAFSNAPMLAINDEMGFVVIAEQTAWQVDVSELRRRLGS